MDWKSILAAILNKMLIEYGSWSTLNDVFALIISERRRSVGIKKWKDEMWNEYDRFPDNFHDARAILTKYPQMLNDAISKLDEYVDRYNDLKEAIVILELALWKMKLEESMANYCKMKLRHRTKRTKMDNSGFRTQCHISCKADVIIENVLPYLAPMSGV